MNIYNCYKKKIIISFLITLIPSFVNAGFWDGFDRTYNFLKENSSVVITAFVGISCCSLLLWKKNKEIKDLKEDHKKNLKYECQGATLRAHQDCKNSHPLLIGNAAREIRAKESDNKLRRLHKLEADLKLSQELNRKLQEEQHTLMVDHDHSSDVKNSSELIHLILNVYPEPYSAPIRRSSLKQTNSAQKNIPRSVIGVKFASDQ